MNDEVLLIVACSCNYASRANTEALALGLLNHVIRDGGAGWAGWVNDRLNVRMQNTDFDKLQPIVVAWVHAAERDAESLTIVQQRRPKRPLPNPKAEIPWGTVVHTRLTRKLLNQLPEGAWVISNCYARTGEPIFEQRLGFPDTREAAWHLAIEARANNRICHVAWTDIELNGPTLPNWLGRPIRER